MSGERYMFSQNLVLNAVIVISLVLVKLLLAKELNAVGSQSRA
jgi:hypothetical protein